MKSNTSSPINPLTLKPINLSFRRQLFDLSLLFLVIAISSSCVTNKKYQYFQKDDVNVKTNAMPKDSVIRAYMLTNYEYKIQAEDVLNISFKSLTPEELDFFSIQGSGAASGGSSGGGSGGNLVLRGYLVDENGEVEFPVVGSVKVEGLTVYEAQNRILEIADQYLKNPVVDVRMLNFRFTVIGEVDNQGVFTSYNNRTSLPEALGMAGGVGDLADRSNIKVLRQQGDDVEVFYVNLLSEDFINSPFYYMHQNDVVVVPPLKQRPFRQYFSQNLAILVSSISFGLLVYGLFFAN